VGRWEWFHPSGQTAQIGAFSGGVKVGKWLTFFDNGAKASEGFYLAGRRDGEWTYWTSSGAVERVQRWDQGVLIPGEAGDIPG
jgi:antitoxin component YwqK of YwqJK toxin-antitoxin module